MLIILIKISLVISLVVVIFGYMVIKAILDRFKKENPDVKFIQHTPLERVISFIRLNIIVLLPIYNLILLLALVFCNETIEEQIYDKIYDFIEQ